MSVRKIRFQYPGGDLAFYTGLILLFIPFGILIAIDKGVMEWYITLLLLMAIPSLGIWFRVRTAGFVFFFLSVLGLLIGVLSLFVLPFRMKMLLRLFITASTAHSAWSWTQRIQAENEMLDEGHSFEFVAAMSAALKDSGLTLREGMGSGLFEEDLDDDEIE